MSAASSWITKQVHMVTYSDEIFNCWIKIIENLEKENKKPPTTVFRFLCGLVESEVKTIQDEIMAEKIVLSKSAKDIDVIDMYDRIKQLKQDKLIQDALLEEFNTLNQSSPCKDWEEVVSTYNLNNIVYKTILALCEEWVKRSLKRGTKKMAFPDEAKKYVQWAIHLHKAEIEFTDLPWSIYAVSLQMEGNLYLKRHFNNEIPIGLCVLDLTKNPKGNLQWSKETFNNALDGIMASVGGSTDPEFVFLAFVDFTQFTELQSAFQHMEDNVNYYCCGALHHFPLAPCKGAIQFLTVLAFLGRGNAFEEFLRSSHEHPMVIDCSLLQVTNERMPDSEYLEAKKRFLIKNCINMYCSEGRKLVDLFGDGSLVAEEGLKQKKEVLCLIDSVEEQRTLAIKLLEFAKSHEDIREWAGLQTQQSILEIESNATVTEELPIEEEEERPLSMADFLQMESRMF